MKTVRDTINHHIQHLEGELAKARAALAAYDSALSTGTASSTPPPYDGDAPRRFTGVRPYDAVRTLLEEHGGRMRRSELMDALLAGGAATGKKRGHHNLRISIDLNINLGKLRAEGDDIVLNHSRMPQTPSAASA